MAPKSKRQILQEDTLQQLKIVKNKMDPRTYTAFQRNIYNAVGLSALNKFQEKIEAIKEIESEKKYTKTAEAKIKNAKNKIENQEVLKYLKQPEKTFYVKGTVEILYNYKDLRKSRYNKNGRKKGELYEHVHEKIKENDVLKTIKARSEAEAIEKYKKQIYEDHGNDDGGFVKDTFVTKTTSVQGVSNITATAGGSGSATGNMMMRKYEPLKYNFIQSNEKLISNPGFCVPDVFVGTYSKYIKKLTLEYFIKLCYEARGEHPTQKQKLLDLDIEDEIDESDKWDISKGVSPDMLKYICKKLNISMYAFDINKQCFLKTIATHRNYPVFIFYAVSNHCYHIRNPEITKSLVEQEKDIEHKIKSNY